MSQKDFEIRFDKARVRLNSSLKELDKAIFDKIHEASMQSRILHNSTDDKALDAKVVEQLATIQNLSDELNKLQQNLVELGSENDSLIEENKNLEGNVNKFRSQGSTLVKAIESDLVRIEEIITGAKNG